VSQVPGMTWWLHWIQSQAGVHVGKLRPPVCSVAVHFLFPGPVEQMSQITSVGRLAVSSFPVAPAAPAWVFLRIQKRSHSGRLGDCHQSQTRGQSSPHTAVTSRATIHCPWMCVGFTPHRDGAGGMGQSKPGPASSSLSRQMRQTSVFHLAWGLPSQQQGLPGHQARPPSRTVTVTGASPGQLLPSKSALGSRSLGASWGGDVLLGRWYCPSFFFASFLSLTALRNC
jgi:hypothetical protein